MLGSPERGQVVMLRLLAAVLFCIDATRDDELLLVAAETAACTAHIVVIYDTPLPGDRKTQGDQIFVMISLKYGYQNALNWKVHRTHLRRRQLSEYYLRRSKILALKAKVAFFGVEVNLHCEQDPGSLPRGVADCAKSYRRRAYRHRRKTVFKRSNLRR
jgi:hypothetical protein